MKVGVVVPSYYNEDWKKNIKRFSNSLEYLEGVDNLVFLFNFQNLPTDFYLDGTNEIKAIIHELFYDINMTNSTWNYYYQVVPKYNPVSMCRIRNDCMMMCPDCDVYLFLDDDHYFKAGSAEHYNLAIKSFEEDPELGLVMCAGYLGGYNYVGKLKYDYAKFWMTSRGLFLRNIHRCLESPIYPASLLEYHSGGYEETLASMEIFQANLKMATLFNCPTLHPRTVHMEGSKNKNEDDEVHNVDVSAESLERYIFEQFNEKVRIDGADSIRKCMKMLYKKGLGYRYV